MKYLLMIIIVLGFGLFGYYQKQKIKNKNKLVQLIIDYVNFYDANLSVFKNDLFEINNNFIIMQNNKNANINNLVIKNADLFQINHEMLHGCLKKDNELSLIVNYFHLIGRGEYDDEKTKNAEMIRLLEKMQKRTTEEIKTKGDMNLKIILAVGAVIAILIWWIYGCFCFI